MKDWHDQIEALESRIAEKENEIQLLKDDLETLRTAIEAAIEQEGIKEEEPQAEEPSITPPPAENIAPEPDPLEADEQETDPETDTEKSERDHEAIIRTIEEFASKHKSPPAYNGPISEKETLGDKVGGSRLNDIRKAMGINERFLFANELFNGDMSALTKAVEELNHLDSLDDANRLLESELSIKYNWDEENETVTAFKSLVSRRFA